MKILRLGDKGKEIPATLDQDGQYRDLSSHIDDISPAAMALEQLARLKSIDITSLPLLDRAMRIGCPINDVPNFFCVGLNYARHADETGMARPSEPILFSKATSALSAPNDDISIPQESEKTDWEVELGVIIGKSGSYINEANSLDHIAGYCTINDLSERGFQIERGGQWIKGNQLQVLVLLAPI